MVVLKGRKGPRGRQRRRFDSRTVLAVSLVCVACRMFFSRDVGEFGGTTTRRRATRTRTLGEEGHDDHRYGIIDRAITALVGTRREKRREDEEEEDYQNDLKWDENLEQNLSEKQEERKLEAREKRKQDHLLGCRPVSIGYDYSRCNSGKCRSDTRRISSKDKYGNHSSWIRGTHR